MWKTVEEFRDWYVANKFPIRPPFEDPVYITDISYSYVLFREGQYQAELYLVRPNTASPEHSHPHVENIIMCLGGDINFSYNGTYHDLSQYHDKPNPDGTSRLFKQCGAKLTDQNTHSLVVGNKGGAFLSLEKWPDGVKPNSVTINWAGEPVCDGHEKIIENLHYYKSPHFLGV